MTVDKVRKKAPNEKKERNEGIEQKTKEENTRINETNICLEFVSKCFEGTKCVCPFFFCANFREF